MSGNYTDGDEEGDGIPFGSPPNPELEAAPSPVIIPDNYQGPTIVPSPDQGQGRGGAANDN